MSLQHFQHDLEESLKPFVVISRSAGPLHGSERLDKLFQHGLVFGDEADVREALLHYYCCDNALFVRLGGFVDDS